jgi:phage gp36-like protein
MGYLTIDRYKVLALVPPSYVDEVEAMAPGFTEAAIDVASDWIDSQLRKRYAAPFQIPIPGVVEQWVSRMVTPDLLVKRGVNATDEQFVYLERRADAAAKEIQEAANSETGLYDLPLRDDRSSTGIVYGTPGGYSEQSPYVWTNVQAEAARGEDYAGRGSGGPTMPAGSPDPFRRGTGGPGWIP